MVVLVFDRVTERFNIGFPEIFEHRTVPPMTPKGQLLIVKGQQAAAIEFHTEAVPIFEGRTSEPFNILGYIVAPNNILVLLDPVKLRV